ncbi:MULTISPECIES: hypothetical protein [unclassified Duganella]|uniref:hypothetical protein n=1 Tax=unclassified Duganella TaxID=2636909 RepID=UPI0006FBD614|nr:MULTISPECIES: hypothetical protein [unclassified Duganella]KQV59674.1 hypothetical protein ASD07_22865 [Duganella sp. Root336D2]KRB87156.1 hypothetical protein ASE26_07065 [Duganella sp. Root198D2]
MKRLLIPTLLLAALATGIASARPAWWYLYQSRIDGQRACSQTPLGEGWVQMAGPFKDAHCENLVRNK